VNWATFFKAKCTTEMLKINAVPWYWFLSLLSCGVPTGTGTGKYKIFLKISEGF
jgi:hypothetical protein